MQHQQSMVPTKPLGGFKSSTKPEDKPAEPAKYNQMAPPMTAYTAEYALAKASAAMEGGYRQVLSFDSLSSSSCCRMPWQTAAGDAPHSWPGKAADAGGAGSAGDPASAAGHSPTFTSI